MNPYLDITQIILAIALVIVVLLQSKGAGFSGTFNNDASVFRTRRGLEKTLFQLGIGLSVAFVVVAIVNVVILSRSGG